MQRAGEQLGKARFLGLRKVDLSGCDIHTALILRSSERLSDERNHGGLEDHASMAYLIVPRVSITGPFVLPPRYGHARDKLTCQRHSIS